MLVYAKPDCFVYNDSYAESTVDYAVSFADLPQLDADVGCLPLVSVGFRFSCA